MFFLFYLFEIRYYGLVLILYDLNEFLVIGGWNLVVYLGIMGSRGKGVVFLW